MFFLTTNGLLAEETFTFIGSFDNVKATETGHCYGEGISLWELENKKVIGLLNIAQGLCGDPACSALEGNSKKGKIILKSLMPIYGQAYTFEGTVTAASLSGTLNNNKTILKKDTSSQRFKNKSEWCATWSKISRCVGVSSVCN